MRYRLLVVEDNEADREQLKRFLAPRHDVEFAASLGEGRARLTSGNFDLVLVDYFLGDGHGVELIEGTAVPVIVLTGVDQAKVAVEAMQRGAYDYVVKDLRSEYLEQLEDTFEAVLACAAERRDAQKRAESLEAVNAELKRATRRYRALAMKDALTGLPNPRELQRFLVAELSRARRGNGPIAAILADFDDFKSVNDRHGHAAGDTVLEAVARRLEAGLRPTDCLARIGGDEFLALLPGTRVGEAFQIADRLRKAISNEPVVLPDATIAFTASFGVCVVPEHAVSIEAVVRAAEATLARSKSRGKDRVSMENVVGDDCGSSPLLARLLSGDAIATLVDEIHELVGGKRVGQELSSRGPIGGGEEVEDVLGFARDHGRLTAVDLACLARCVQVAARQTLRGRVHVNLLPSTLVETGAGAVAAALAEPPPGARFCVELSERQFVGEPARLASHAESLRQAGVLLAIDDVGFGRTSLETLIVLEPEFVKLDASLIRGCSKRGEQRRQLLRLCGVLDSLGIRAIAAGVDHADDRRVLVDIGVQHGQGTLWGKPQVVAQRFDRGAAG